MISDDEDDRRNAAIICCNGDHLPFASMVLFLMDYHNPDRNFDLVLCASEPLELPAILQRIGVKLVLFSPTRIQSLSTKKLPTDAYLRLWLAKQLGAEYRRILYLDTDIYIQGGDVGRLLNSNLGSHPLGAVLERPMWGRPNHHAKDFKSIGLNAAPYFNSGVLLVDTDQYNSRGVLEACLEVSEKYSDILHYHDQSLLNIALYKDWAQLHPIWNWQWATRKPILEPIASPYFVHFYGPKKPWLKNEKEVPRRYRDAYSAFLRREFSNFEPRMGDIESVVDTTRPDLKFLQQAFSWLKFRNYFNSFEEPFNTISDRFSK